MASRVGRATHGFVILGRSKERSDAAQTLESVTFQPYSDAELALAPALLSGSLHSSVDVTEWILGSARPLRSRSARG
ncbi:hypothetical protein FJ980_14330 [Mesorhizobium sp. B1-1-5]|nr:hypothetical protein FJ980_14330 [Mesorhizobium sp. B1-1-5]